MSNTESLRMEKKAYGDRGMYHVEHRVEGTGELRMIDTCLESGQVVERQVFRNNHLCTRTIPHPNQVDILHKTSYRENGSVKSYSEFVDSKIYTTDYDKDGNVEGTEVRDIADDWMFA